MSRCVIRCTTFLLVTLLFGVFTIGSQASPQPEFAILSPELNFLLKRTQALTHSSLPLSDVVQLSGGVPQSAFGFDDEPLVGVLIRTHSVTALRQRGLKLNTVAGDIVSARVTLSQLRSIQQWPEVIYVEGTSQLELTSQPMDVLMPDINKSLEAIGARRMHQRGITGKGVVVGIVDTGVDYMHPDFRVDKDGDGVEESTRILGIWDQTTPGNRPMNFNYGVEYTREEIKAALLDPSLVPHVDANPSSPSHGTQALGIAAGDGSASDKRFVGVAPDADLVVVKSPLIGDTVLDGVQYIFNMADEKPAVVSLSLGGHVGAHDGTSNLERAFDELTEDRGRVIVVSAGNDGDENIHVNGALAATAKVSFTFDIPSASRSRYSFDFWYESNNPAQGVDPIEVRVIGPGGDPTGSVLTGELYDESIADGGVFIDNASQGPNPNNNRNQLMITVYDQILGSQNPLQPGRWTIELKAPGIGVNYHGWSLNLPFSSSNANNRSTVRVPATGNSIIAVGAYVTRNEWPSLTGGLEQFHDDNATGEIAAFSSLGPTLDGRIKPDLTAPGSMIVGPLSKDSFLLVSVERILPDEMYMVNRGTSFAAPHVSGAAALLLQMDRSMSAQEVLDELTTHASRDTKTGFFNTNIWGNGRLNLDFNQPPTVPSTDLADALDADGNGLLGDQEILTAIQFWISGDAAANELGVEISDGIILMLIEAWIREVPLAEI